MEFQADLDFAKYLLVADYGITNSQRLTSSSDFTTQGSFFRLGVDLNLIKNDPKVQAATVGLRYGRSQFDNTLSFTQYDSLYGNYSYQGANSGISAHWIELAAGLRAHVWNNFYMGFTYRMKFRLRVENEGQFTAYEVPGYGIRGRDPWSGFNYYLMYRIAWREKKIVVKEEK